MRVSRVAFWLAELILLASAGLRLTALSALPPGFNDRELTTLRLVEAARQGRIEVFYDLGEGPGGREGLFAQAQAALTSFVGVGMFFVDRSALMWPGIPDGDSIGRAVLVLIFAYAGIEVALAPSGEVHNPAHTVPRAIFLALAITTTLYVAIQLVAQGVLGTLLAQQTAAPLAEAAARFLGGAGATLMLAGAVCSMFGYQCGDMLSTPRSLYALARDGFAPSILAYVDPQHRTPSVAIWTHATLALALAGTQTFEVLAVISNVGLLLLYLLACGAALELARRDVRTTGTPFRIPGARAAPFLAAGIVIWVLTTATVKEFAVTAVVLGIATLAYVVRKRAQSHGG